MRKGFLFLLLAIVVGLFTAYFPEYSFSLDILFLGLIIGFWCIHLNAPEDAKFLLMVFLAGYLLRILLAIILHLYSLPFGYGESRFGFEGFFIGDSWGYYNNGRLFSSFWEQGYFPDMETFRVRYSLSRTVSAYDYFNGSVIWFTGERTPLMFFFLNSTFGAFSILLIYFIAVRLAGNKFARYASVFYCFWPSILLWSTQNLKEPICSFLVYIVILGMITLLRKFSVWYLLVIVLASYILTMFRSLMGAVAAALFLIFYLILLAESRNKILYVLIGVILTIMAYWVISRHAMFTWTKELMFKNGGIDISYFLERLSIDRSLRAFGGSAILPNLEYTSLAKLLFFAPVGIAIVFLLPFPWQIGSAMQIISIPEMLVWYALIPCTLYGCIHCFRKDRGQAAIVTLYILIMACMLGLAEGNVGTLFRHRSVIFGLCLIFTATGFQLQKERSILQRNK